MAANSVTSKIVMDIKDCIIELKRYFITVNIPINDDHSSLHLFQQKLEMVLQCGLKEKAGMFGMKKSYWNYILSCFSSSKNLHEGIKVIKSNSEIKSSLGRGRALIRYCLMKKCLADTLQICFNDIKNTCDFYSDHHLPRQPKYWLSFFSSLYELNEINFDLNPYDAELDVSWPSFARKLFTSVENQAKSSINLNSTNQMSSPQLLQGTAVFSSQTEQNSVKVINMSSHDGDFSGCISDDCTKGNDFNADCNAETEEGHCVCDPTNLCFCRKHTENPQVISDDEKLIIKSVIYNSHSNRGESLFSSEHFDTSTYSEDSTYMTNPEKQNSEEQLNIEKQNITKKNLVLDLSEVNYIDTSHSNSITVLVSEIKVLIDSLTRIMDQQTDQSLILSYVTKLRNVIHTLDSDMSEKFGKMRECKIENQKLQKCVYDIISISQHQEDLINTLTEKIGYSMKEHKNLHDNICFLHNKLHSYGLLKTQSNSSQDLQCFSLSVDKIYNSDLYEENSNCDMEACTNMLNNSFRSINIFKKSCSKLHSLNIQTEKLQSSIKSSYRLNNNLISRVQDQELHMKGITKELEEAHELLSVMQKQHKKLQSAENIVKYDLQEKRKLLNRLKQQLEATREDCNLVKLKNSESEVEWKNIRKEFVQRHKQASEESGFIDDKGMEDDACESTDTVCEYNSSDNISNSEICLNNSSVDVKKELKKSRLQILEEQCKELCSNLINSSKKREEIDHRLETWCKVIEKSNKVPVELDSSTVISEIDNVCKNVSNDHDNTVADFIVNVDSSLSSEVESLDSNCCSNMLHSIAVTTGPLESATDYQTLSSDPINCLCNKNEALPDKIPDTINCLITGSTLVSTDTSLSSKSLTTLEEISDCQFKCSKVSEINIPASDLNAEEDNETNYKSSLNVPDMTKSVSQLEEEKHVMMSRFVELQTENEIIMKELKQKTQQLQLMESIKNQEISALQFQLNSESLKYERAVKNFRKNNDNVNDMKQKVSAQEQLILALEEALTEIQVQHESEREHQWEQLEDIRKYSLKDKAAMEEEIIHLKNDLKMFQRKIIKLLKEKDIMWKRNEYLMHLQKTQIDDRWLDDHEVSECLGCKCQFSFILRKHHCRQCGRIFCNSCSNNWLMTPSSRKQIRVCNECYKEHIKIKTDVRRNSNDLFFGADEEADDDLCISNTNLISEIHPNITDSFVSLPVMKVSELKKNSHYTSAPELYSPLENCDKISRRSVDDSVSSSLLELAQQGTIGELFINSNEEAVLTIFNQHPTSLQWNFTTIHEAIPISLIYENECHSNSQKNVIHQSSCETEGIICLSLPGIYKFYFDNRLRLYPISVKYSYQLQVETVQAI